MAVVEGMVAGVTITSEDIADQLARRRLGYGRGARMKFERDQVTLLAGVRPVSYAPLALASGCWVVGAVGGGVVSGAGG
ncbi:hypothetical protein BKN37_21705 [Mycobacterium talmoniae]|uniref:chorismate synthase n=1 Tax=Mycobacterium talmoniae TaxID=1858794 RepID=A0A1S1N8F2_9MYCO|nr:hypothetical protein BKN37_21705 [Mycobacterium talmoniae]